MYNNLEIQLPKPSLILYSACKLQNMKSTPQQSISRSTLLLGATYNIYIYIYRERERERERDQINNLNKFLYSTCSYSHLTAINKLHKCRIPAPRQSEENNVYNSLQPKYGGWYMNGFQSISKITVGLINQFLLLKSIGARPFIHYLIPQFLYIITQYILAKKTS